MTALELLVRVFNIICFMLSILPVGWVIACMVPLYNDKGNVHKCSNFGSISLLSMVGKVYGRVLINRIRDKTENVIAEVQSGFRRGRGCTDQGPESLTYLRTLFCAYAKKMAIVCNH